MYYRGCWHIVSHRFLTRYRQIRSISSTNCSSLATALYNPRAFIVHAVSLHQAFAHCGIFPTAASRRSLGRISVPMWPFSLSTRLNIIALVGHYLTNQLMFRTLISQRSKRSFHNEVMRLHAYPALTNVSIRYSNLRGRLSTCYSPIRR